MSRPAQEVSVFEGKPLTEEELESLNTKRGVGVQSLKNIRETHRLLARLLAIGTTEKEASVIVGISPSRISILKNDPAFQGLMEVYKAKQDILTQDIMQRFAELGMNAVEELRDRLLEKPEEFAAGQLLEIATEALDRLGHSPTQKIAVAHVNLDEIKKRAAESRSDQILFRDNVQQTLLGYAQEVNEAPTGRDDLSAESMEVLPFPAKGEAS